MLTLPAALEEFLRDVAKQLASGVGGESRRRLRAGRGRPPIGTAGAEFRPLRQLAQLRGHLAEAAQRLTEYAHRKVIQNFQNIAVVAASGSGFGCHAQERTNRPPRAGIFRSSIVFQSASAWQG